MSGRGGREAGFTLLEILVVTAVTLMIAMAAAGGLRLGARAWEGASREVGGAVEAQALEGFLRRLAESVETVRWRDGSREPPALFLGDAAGFVTVATPPAALAPAAPQQIALRAAPQGDAVALTLRWRPLDAGPPPAGPAGAEGWGGAAERLAGDLRAVRFRYGDAAGMADVWPPSAQPPRLIEIAVTGRDGATATVLAAPMARGGPP